MMRDMFPKWPDLRNTIEIFSICNFFLLLFMAFGQVPLDKILNTWDNNYKQEAVQFAKDETCAHIESKSTVYGSKLKNAFIRGCMWDIMNFRMREIVGDQAKMDEIVKGFGDPSSKIYMETENYCQVGIAEREQAVGTFEDEIIKDLWTYMQCEGPEPRSDQ